VRFAAIDRKPDIERRTQLYLGDQGCCSQEEVRLSLVEYALFRYPYERISFLCGTAAAAGNVVIWVRYFNGRSLSPKPKVAGLRTNQQPALALEVSG
jgi:hypothetical protein